MLDGYLNLSKNLISIGILDYLDYTYKINQGSMYIAKGVTVLKGIKIAGLYNLIKDTLHGVASIATTQNNNKATLWHQKIGHINEKDL